MAKSNDGKVKELTSKLITQSKVLRPKTGMVKSRNETWPLDISSANGEPSKETKDGTKHNLLMHKVQYTAHSEFDISLKNVIECKYLKNKLLLYSRGRRCA